MTADKLRELDGVLRGCRNVLTLIHDYPDPDAIASAIAFSHLMHERYGIRTRIAYGGLITRAENRAMVQLLQIPMTHVNDLPWRRYRVVALLDTQPGFGNHSLPPGIKPTIVIDHHEMDRTVKAPFVDIRQEYGACATLLFEYLQEAGIEPTVQVATAIAFAIRTETQELGREASDRDIEAYLDVYPKANKKKIARIANPKLPHSYFLSLQAALNRARVFRHLAHVNLGEVDSPEIVSQIADLLLRHTGIGWALATGRYSGQLFLSLRASHPRAHAGRIMKYLVGPDGSGGGHGTMAGGRLMPNEGTNPDWEDLEATVARRFLRALGYSPNGNWKPLLG